MKKRFNLRLTLILLASTAAVALLVVVAHACQVGPESAALLAGADRAEGATSRAGPPVGLPRLYHAG